MDNVLPDVAWSVSSFEASKRQTDFGASILNGVLEGEKKPRDYLH